jgi:hypothetical protein
VVRAAIERLVKIGLLEISGCKRRKKSVLGLHPPAGKSQPGAGNAQEDAAERKGTEHHHQEGNRKGSRNQKSFTNLISLERK